MESIELPQAFDFEKESVKYLQREKRRAAKDFKWTKSKSVGYAGHLATALYVFGRDDEALEVCRFLEQYEPSDPINGHIWSSVQKTLALRARIERLRGNDKTAKALVARFITIRTIG